MVDAVLIENVSNQSITVGALLGNRISTPRLRVAASQPFTATAAKAVDMSEPIAPGERLIVFTKITFVPDETFFMDILVDGRKSGEIRNRIGVNGFQEGGAGHGVPSFKNYVFGPELTVSGFILDGKSVALSGRPSANFNDLVVSRVTGSCPYLLSWDNRQHLWIEHGKILDQAPRQELEYSELRTFAGFRGRFRIEERSRKRPTSGASCSRLRCTTAGRSCSNRAANGIVPEMNTICRSCLAKASTLSLSFPKERRRRP